MGRLINADSAYTVLTDYYHHKTDAQHMALKDALDKVETVDAIPVDWIEAQIPGSAEFYAVVTTIILRHLIDKYRKEQNNDIY